MLSDCCLSSLRRRLQHWTVTSIVCTPCWHQPLLRCHDCTEKCRPCTGAGGSRTRRSPRSRSTALRRPRSSMARGTLSSRVTTPGASRCACGPLKCVVGACVVVASYHQTMATLAVCRCAPWVSSWFHACMMLGLNCLAIILRRCRVPLKQSSWVSRIHMQSTPLCKRMSSACRATCTTSQTPPTPKKWS